MTMTTSDTNHFNVFIPPDVNKPRPAQDRLMGRPVEVDVVRRALTRAMLVAAFVAFFVGVPVAQSVGEPDTSIDSGPSGTVSSTSANFSFSSTTAGATFECSLDSAAFASCTSPQSYSGLSVGDHNFQVRAIAGPLVDPTPASQSWTIAPPPPDTSIDSGPSGTVSSTSANFSFSSTTAGATFECSLDSAAFASCTSPKGYSGLSVGDHNFQVTGDRRRFGRPDTCVAVVDDRTAAAAGHVDR